MNIERRGLRFYRVIASKMGKSNFDRFCIDRVYRQRRNKMGKGYRLFLVVEIDNFWIVIEVDLVKRWLQISKIILQSIVLRNSIDGVSVDWIILQIINMLVLILIYAGND
jgi:hypothetical protein